MSTLSAQHWDAKVKMDPFCTEELCLWTNNLNSIKVRNCFLFNRPQRFVYSDTSVTGCGSVITLDENCVCHKLWEPSECSKSSTWRELAAMGEVVALRFEFLWGLSSFIDLRVGHSELAFSAVFAGFYTGQ